MNSFRDYVCRRCGREVPGVRNMEGTRITHTQKERWGTILMAITFGVIPKFGEYSFSRDARPAVLCASCASAIIAEFVKETHDDWGEKGPAPE